jgi:hypothetical protein
MARPAAYDPSNEMRGLSIQEGEGVSSKATRFPARPSPGGGGRRCILYANHFFAKFKPDLELYHYDVSDHNLVPERPFLCRLKQQGGFIYEVARAL